MVRRQVSLVDVSEEEAKGAAQVIQALFEKYGISSQDCDVIWKACQMALTYALLEEGKIPGTSDGKGRSQRPARGDSRRSRPRA